MRISTKGRYSLAALLYMATRPACVYVNTKEIAAAADTTEGYIEQLFIQLRQSGIIEGIRGRNGGYTLAKPRDQIYIGDILRSCEGSLKPAVCVDANTCPVEQSCLSRHTWHTLYNVISTFLDGITLEDVLSDYNAHENPEYVI
jgi:Rrf2 family protein